MFITRLRNPLRLPSLSFWTRLFRPTKDYLKLLGFTFDSKLSFGQHLHRTSVRAHHRLHFLPQGGVCAGRQGLRYSLHLSGLLWSTALLFGTALRQHTWLSSTPSKPELSISLVKQLLYKHCMPIGLLLQPRTCSNSGTRHQLLDCAARFLCPSLLPT